jgi:hypothetical protein
MVLALACARCSLFLKADAGYAHAFAQAPERSAAAVNAYAGFGAGGDYGGVGGGWSVRTKWSDNVQQFSLAPFLYAMAGAHEQDGSPPIAAFLLGGVHVLTAEAVAGKGEVSLGSPFVELGTFVHVHHTWGLTASVSFEDDIRFDATPNTGYVSFVLGFAVLGYRDGGANFFWH